MEMLAESCEHFLPQQCISGLFSLASRTYPLVQFSEMHTLGWKSQRSVGVHFHVCFSVSLLEEHTSRTTSQGRVASQCYKRTFWKAPSRSKPLGVNVQGVYESSYHVPLLEVHIYSSFSQDNDSFLVSYLIQGIPLNRRCLQLQGLYMYYILAC